MKSILKLYIKYSPQTDKYIISIVEQETLHKAREGFTKYFEESKNITTFEGEQNAAHKWILLLEPKRTVYNSLESFPRIA